MDAPRDARETHSVPADEPTHLPHPFLALVLVNALDAVKSRRRGFALRRAREWICVEQEPRTLGFEQTCRDLALDPVVIRRRVGLRRSRGRVVSRRGFRRGPSA
jgi:hypothetical protein